MLYSIQYTRWWDPTRGVLSMNSATLAFAPTTLRASPPAHTAKYVLSSEYECTSACLPRLSPCLPSSAAGVSAPKTLNIKMEAVDGVRNIDPDTFKAPAPTEFAYGIAGSLAPVGDFDPFNFLDGKTKDQVLAWREAELAHCRVGMLAATGFLVQEKFHPLFSGDGGPAIEQIPKLPVFMWFAMTLAPSKKRGMAASLAGYSVQVALGDTALLLVAVIVVALPLPAEGHREPIGCNYNGGAEGLFSFLL